ncbi:MAG: hypothetical protein ABI892_00160 [Flavobacterium sp.]
MTKKLSFQLFVLLFLMHGTVLSMHAIKKVRTTRSKFNRNVGTYDDVLSGHSLVLQAQPKKQQTDSLVAIEKALKNIENKLEYHDKILDILLDAQEYKHGTGYYYGPLNRGEIFYQTSSKRPTLEEGLREKIYQLKLLNRRIRE